MPKRTPPPPGQLGQVYLIHLDEPIGHVRHYLGWALDATVRLKYHQAGRGGHLLKIANKRGIGYQIARVWEPADRRFERRAKTYSHGPQLCPMCNPETWHNWLPIVNDAKRIKKPRKAR